MIFYLVTEGAANTLALYLPFWGKPIAPWFRIVPYERLMKGCSLPAGTYIFSDLERLTSEQTERAVALWDALAAGGKGIRLLNHPARILGRYELLRTLHEKGINAFDVYRLEENPTPRFPVFLRDARDHCGNLTPLLHTQEELDGAVQAALEQGVRPENTLVVEFCDTSDADGIFRKYGAYLVGGRVIAWHVFYSRDWMIKYGNPDLAVSELCKEESRHVATNPHKEQLRGIFETARINYGRIDYGLLDGKIQVWEINTNPTLRSPFSDIPVRVQLLAPKIGRLNAAFAAINAEPNPKVRVDIPPATGGVFARAAWRLKLAVRAALGMPPSPPRYESVIRTRLRPLKRWLRAAMRRKSRAINIRKMAEADMAAVLELLAKWNMAPKKPTPEMPDPERSSVNVAHSFVATNGGRIVGVSSYIVHTEELGETASHAVDPDYRGAGIGYKLQIARFREMKQRGIKKVRTETDRPETIQWLVKHFGGRIVGTNEKKHAFSLPDVDEWTVLEFDLEDLPS